ncbi:unnamed protein product [Linum trigynum]|uniref:Uncharacterized protein n=1 Tax=Linum trigynum TaxID=586398 RepID=A0AAV2ERM6_9ROSI
MFRYKIGYGIKPNRLSRDSLHYINQSARPFKLWRELGGAADQEASISKEKSGKQLLFTSPLVYLDSKARRLLTPNLFPPSRVHSLATVVARVGADSGCRGGTGRDCETTVGSAIGILTRRSSTPSSRRTGKPRLSCGLIAGISPQSRLSFVKGLPVVVPPLVATGFENKQWFR